MAMDSSLLYWDMGISFMLHLAGPFALAAILSGALKDFSAMSRVYIIILASAAWSFIVNFGALLFLQATSCGGVNDFAGVAIGAAISAVLTAFFMWIPSIWEGLRLAISQVFVAHKPMLSPAEAAQERALIQAGTQFISASQAVPVATAPKAIAVPVPGYTAVPVATAPKAIAVPVPGYTAVPVDMAPKAIAVPVPGYTAVPVDMAPKAIAVPVPVPEQPGTSSERIHDSDVEIAPGRFMAWHNYHGRGGAQKGGGERITPEEYQNLLFNEIKSALAYMAAFAGAYGVGIGSRFAVNCKTV